MDEPDDNRDPDDREEIEGNEEIGPLLRRLRGVLSLRDVTARTGVSSSYLSQIERGGRKPGSNMVRKLAALYNVDEQELMKRAGRVGQPRPLRRRGDGDRAGLPVRAGRSRLPRGHKARRPHHPKHQRFIIEMYERFANKRLLE